MTDLAIETRGLTKSFGGRVVVDGLDLEVPRGAVFGFLGPNGSGKTTTVRMLLGLAFPTAGTARVLGSDIPRSVASVLPVIGALVEGPAFYPYLSGRRNLERLDAMASRRARKGRPDIDKALALVGLTHSASKRYRNYSLGMKQRLALAAALMRKPELLVLDEPTNGLDPQGTREVRNLIRRLNDDGTTVFLSSHLLSEVDQVCTHAAVLTAGRIVAQGRLDELRKARRTIIRIETPDLQLAQEVLLRTPGADNVVVEERARGGGYVEVELTEKLLPEQIAAALVHADVRLRSMAESRPSLEETFVALTGEGFDVAE